MSFAQAVIGAGLGDEGKGKTVDFLAYQLRDQHPIVVRFNGGAQAGHTVETPDGKRHSFHQFGAGTIAGAETYLSQFFIINPSSFVTEGKILQDLSAFMRPKIDGNCRVTTPYDILLNQAAETYRGNNKHGSCGFGVNETVTRHENADFRLEFKDLYTKEKIEKKLNKIQNEWVPARIEALNIEISENLSHFFKSSAIKDDFLRDCEWLISHSLATDIDCLHDRRIIFEGAQGLLLDEEHPNFPYVTRSKTGLTNVVSILDYLDIDDLSVTYVTRCYATRHGVGPLPWELPGPPYKNIVDKTNVINYWQDELRFGWLDLNILEKAIKDDFAILDDYYDRALNIHVTCLDQIDNEAVTFMFDKRQITVNEDIFLSTLDELLEADNVIYSKGPTREYVSIYWHF